LGEGGAPAQFAILQGLFAPLPVDMDMSVLAFAGGFFGEGVQVHMGLLSASGGWKSGRKSGCCFSPLHARLTFRGPVSGQQNVQKSEIK